MTHMDFLVTTIGQLMIYQNMDFLIITAAVVVVVEAILEWTEVVVAVVEVILEWTEVVVAVVEAIQEWTEVVVAVAEEVVMTVVETDKNLVVEIDQLILLNFWEIDRFLTDSCSKPKVSFCICLHFRSGIVGHIKYFGLN
jgi:hypothetical protein